MTCRTLLSIDLSTTCTGYALFDKDSEKLLEHDIIRPKVKGVTKFQYPNRQLRIMIDVSQKIVEMIKSQPQLPETIVIEEIAGSKNRIGQKTLDGVHWILMDALNDLELIDRVVYYDVTGKDGWRYHLNIKLNEADKKNNKKNRKMNKELSKGTSKLPVVGWKHLACRYANEKYGLDLNVESNKFDGDRADAICMGDAYLTVVLPNQGGSDV